MTASWHQPDVGKRPARRVGASSARSTTLRLRERAQATATEPEDPEWRPRVGRHVAWLDHLHTEGSITADQSRSGARFRSRLRAQLHAGQDA